MATDSSAPRRGIVQFTIALVAVTATLYLVSCGLPATDIGSYDGGALNDGPYVRDPTPGWFHLVFGWLDFPRSLPPWSANFVLVAGILSWLSGRRGVAAVLGSQATILGLTTLFVYKHDSRYLGYYVWQGSQVVFAVSTGVGWALLRSQKTPNQSLQQTGHAKEACS